MTQTDKKKVLCSKCKKKKKIEFFSKNKKRKNGLNGWCKSCASAVRKENQRHYRRKELWDKYGITEEAWDNLYNKQKGICPGCLRFMPYSSEGIIGTRPCVDHKHVEGFDDMSSEEKSKYVRGLLCSDCNRGMGWLRDNSTTLYNLHNYLREYESSHIRHT